VRPTAVTVTDRDGPAIAEEPLTGYSGALVTDLAEMGASHLLEGPGFFLQAHGVIVERGTVVGTWGPLTLAAGVYDVLDRLQWVLPDGGYLRENGTTMPRLWMDLLLD
jgi:hypothetical protein